MRRLDRSNAGLSYWNEGNSVWEGWICLADHSQVDKDGLNYLDLWTLNFQASVHIFPPYRCKCLPWPHFPTGRWIWFKLQWHSISNILESIGTGFLKRSWSGCKGRHVSCQRAIRVLILVYTLIKFAHVQQQCSARGDRGGVHFGRKRGLMGLRIRTSEGQHMLPILEMKPDRDGRVWGEKVGGKSLRTVVREDRRSVGVWVEDDSPRRLPEWKSQRQTFKSVWV